MPEQNLKEPQMHLHKNHYFELPKAAVIAFMGAIFIAIFGGIIGYFVQITKLETDVAMLKVQAAETKIIVNDNKKEFQTIRQHLNNIENALNMKQDRKFIE